MKKTRNPLNGIILLEVILFVDIEVEDKTRKIMTKVSLDSRGKNKKERKID